MMEHTKEPWAVYEGEEVHGVLDREGKHLAEMWQRKHYDSLANARRIVACVNACAGISNENLEDDCFNKMRLDRDQFQARAEAAEANLAEAVKALEDLKRIAELHKNNISMPGVSRVDIFNNVKAILSKIKEV